MCPAGKHKIQNDVGQKNGQHEKRPPDAAKGRQKAAGRLLLGPLRRLLRLLRHSQSSVAARWPCAPPLWPASPLPSLCYGLLVPPRRLVEALLVWMPSAAPGCHFARCGCVPPPWPASPPPSLAAPGTAVMQTLHSVPSMPALSSVAASPASFPAEGRLEAARQPPKAARGRQEAAKGRQEAARSPRRPPEAARRPPEAPGSPGRTPRSRRSEARVWGYRGLTGDRGQRQDRSWTAF